MKTSAIITVAALAMAMNINALNPNPSEMACKMDNHSAGNMASLPINEESEIEVTDWMLDVDAFATEHKTLEIEPWMLGDDAFSEPAVTVTIEAGLNFEEIDNEYDEIIELKDWMFDIEAFQNDEDFEEELIELKDWMFDVDAFLVNMLATIH